MKLSSVLAIVATASALIPIPRKFDQSGQHLVIDTTVNVVFTGNVDEVVLDGWSRLQQRFAKTKWFPVAGVQPDPIDTFGKNETTVDTINFSIKKDDADLQFGVDESYTLHTKGSAINIAANTTWGALNGLKTLEQLIIYENGQYFINGTLDVVDKPYFRHRGLMLDTARNFLSIESIKNQIEIMSLVKLNVFHWHIVDSQSWPVQVLKYPKMTTDAYSRTEVYSHEDIKEVVDFAKARGVRVIPEFDMPAHASSGYRQVDPNIIVCDGLFWAGDETHQAVSGEPNPGQLDPTNNKTYEVISNIYDEIGALFPDKFYHFGGDEINAGCYNTSKPVQSWLRQHNGTYGDLLNYWIDRVVPIFRKRYNNSTRLMLWADTVNGQYNATNVPKDVVLQHWLEEVNSTNKLIDAGYDVVLSTATWLYLDCGNGGWVTNADMFLEIPANQALVEGNGGSWCGGYKSWQMLYNFNLVANLTESQASHVLGGEAALWSEQVDDSVVAIKLWPRLAAFAENLWSGNRDDAGYIRTDSVTVRILNFREYVQQAYGVSTHPLVPRWCYKDPHQCDITLNTSALHVGGVGRYYDFQ